MMAFRPIRRTAARCVSPMNLARRSALSLSLLAGAAALLSVTPAFAEPAAPAPAAAAPGDSAGSTQPATDDGIDPTVARDTKHYNVKPGKPAIDGYDPVAYFPAGGGKPAKGKAECSYTYRGVLYYFATAANRDAFKANPRAFEPQYGGWCAYAMADGEKVEVDQKNFKITDGKLFLFYRDFFTDTRAKWNKEEAKLKAKADPNWTKISGEKIASADAAACPLCKGKGKTPDQDQTSVADSKGK